MLFNHRITKTLKTLICKTRNPKFCCLLIQSQIEPPPFCYSRSQNYVDVYMKWKKDPYFDSIEHIHKSTKLKPIIALKNVITKEPTASIPISAISKRGLEFDVHIKVARFLRQYPSVFEEFAGPLHNLPWFRLTPEAVEIDREERRIYEDCREDFRERLRRFILMSKEKVLPLKIIKGLEWYLGLPCDFLENPEVNLDGSFRFVEMEDGLKGLAADIKEETVFTILQRNAMRRGEYSGKPMETIEFPLFPSKGLRLRQKIEDWLKEFQKVPYVSPYDDYSHLDPNSDVSEKRVVGFLHELLSIFVENSVERKRLLCLKKYFGLPQKVHKAFERHPHMFYLSFRNKTCTAILKEPFRNKSAIEEHPLLKIRKRYIKLVNESNAILNSKRVNNRFIDRGAVERDLDSDYEDEDRGEITDCPSVLHELF